MKVAEVVVRILEDEGIQVAFGIPGAAINPVYGFLQNSKIKHYIARHEERAVSGAARRMLGPLAGRDRHRRIGFEPGARKCAPFRPGQRIPRPRGIDAIRVL